uniref:Lipoxygenase domain-containing protein n=1 Tax=Scophthalmus maximus TaxID=52904 RepID=A0A8D3BR83_SCOMX
IELDKQRLPMFPDDDWFLSKVEVKSPEGHTYRFPIPPGICRSMFLMTLLFSIFPRWYAFKEGLPHCIEAENLSSLPCEVRFSFTKQTEFLFTAAAGLVELQLKGLDDCHEPWADIDNVDRVFCSRQTDISEYVQKHWKEDALFGNQYLNGVNPILIKRCKVLPDNFPVTDDMVFLCGQGSLAEEMKRGNIFLCDYKRLDGVQANTINGKRQYLMAPLVLLHKTPNDKLMPIAIQLRQTPADNNPIFNPADSCYDWLIAKIFVRSADFNEHQLNVHLLRTHLLAEVFAVSLLRNIPAVHPLYKLLVPHTRYTLQINYLARNLLISDKGVFSQKSLSAVTYSSLCLPEDIAERGVEDIPNYYYRDDGLRLWNIIHRFVDGVLRFFYKNDGEVEQDTELQKWIRDIFEHGFLSQVDTGIPRRFTTVGELIKFVTMVIFTCSGQHSAVNTGQYDFGGWMPNTPITLQCPPPTKKGTTSEDIMLRTFPYISTTVQGMSTMWLLSKQSSDFVPLGQYQEGHFSEEIPCNMIQAFQRELKLLSEAIKWRNKSLDIPYTYLDPAELENSVAI